MWPYLLCFAVSCICFYIAAFKRYTGKYKQFVLFSIIGIILPCLLAGGRDNTIGTDVLVYGDTIFNMAKSSDFLIFIASSPCEFLYSALVFVLAKVTDITFWQYFVFQLIVVVCIYAALVKQTPNKAWLGMAMYYLMFYGYSLNWMRQMIAMAIIIFAYSYIKSRKPIKYILLVIIAGLFHSSAFVALLFYPMYYLLTDDISGKIKIKLKYGDRVADNKKIRSILEILLVIVFMFVVLKFYSILEQLSSFSNFTALYGNYFEQASSTGSIDIKFFALLLPVIVTGAFYHNRLAEMKTDFRFIFIMFVTGFILYQTKMYGYYSYRISFYFLMFLVMLIPRILDNTENKHKTLILEGAYLAIFAAYFYLDFVVRLSCQVMPYTSKMFGIG